MQALNADFVAVKIKTTDAPELARRFDVDWTPVLAVLDASGKEHYRFIGFLPPAEYLAMLQVGRAAVALRQRRYQEAAELYRRLADERPDSKFRPEALYWLSVALARSGDADGALAARAELKAKYSDSLWTIRLSS